VPAQVIYRNNTSWSSSCWINVGEKENQRLGKAIIAKNSPVVVGYSLIGVIDFVGSHQSRVKLLTDSGLTPSVRAARGEPQQRMLAHQLNLMMDALMDQDKLFSSQEQKMEFISKLEELEKKLLTDPSATYLAKGVLSGSSRPAWRKQGALLKGTGFNNDFADALGPARDLRTGVPVKEKTQPPLAILQEKDLLITTGMDGVFPPGLHVAQVTKISPLKEGDYFYELEAMPIAGDMDEISLVYILPPVGYDANEQPPLMGWE
jgi:cell shape-determining protein MreC